MDTFLRDKQPPTPFFSIKISPNSAQNPYLIKLLRCDECNIFYATNRSLNAHKRMMHSNLVDSVNENKFPCIHCHKVFTSNITLREHMSTHVTGQTYSCKFCPKLFKKKKYLKDHYLLHKSDNKLECNYCGKKFLRKSHLERHLYSHSLEKLYECKLCHIIFDVAIHLKHHMLRVHLEKKKSVSVRNVSLTNKTEKSDECDKKVQSVDTLLKDLKLVEPLYRCKECEKLFKDEASAKKHIDESHLINKTSFCKVKNLECKYCKSKFGKKSSLAKHILYFHTNGRLVKCKQCGKSFSRKSTLQQHMRTHKIQSLHRCEYCNKSFSFPYLLRRHMFLVHSKKKNLHFCKHCHRYFDRLQSLQNHIRHAHQRNCSRECEVCHEKFQPINNLHIHICKCFKCNSCGKMFKELNDYKEHTRVHMNKKPLNYTQTSNGLFTCIHCNKSFPIKCRLVRHMSIHTTEKSLKCECCPSQFKNTENLHKHMRRCHKNVKPFKCTRCNMSFQFKLQMHKHVLLIHQGGTLYKCTVCKKSFVRKDSLEKHTCHPVFANVVEKHEQSFITQRILLEHNYSKSLTEKLFKCVDCDKSFAQRSSLNNHSHQHFRCSLCDTSFKNKREFNEHNCATTSNVTNHSPPHFKCSSCNTSFKNKRELKDHNCVSTRSLNNNSQHFRCNHCNTIFRDKRRLNEHNCASRNSLNSNSHQNFRCNQCDTTFSNTRELKEHNCVSTCEKSYRCEFCDISFMLQHTLSTHMKYAHCNANSDPLVIVPQKSKTSNVNNVRQEQESVLNRHVNRCEYNCFKCLYCTKTFGTKVELVLHAKRYALNHIP